MWMCFKLQRCIVSLFITYFLLNLSVFEEHVDNNILKSVVIDALLRFTAMYCMNTLCKWLFIVLLFAFMYATVVVFAVTLLIIMWWLFRAYLLLIMFSSSLSLLLWFVHVMCWGWCTFACPRLVEVFTHIESIRCVVMWWN